MPMGLRWGTESVIISSNEMGLMRTLIVAVGASCLMFCAHAAAAARLTVSAASTLIAIVKPALAKLEMPPWSRTHAVALK